MLKLVFGFLGLLVVLAIAASLARSQLGWTWPFGLLPAEAAAGGERAGIRAAGAPLPVPRRDGATATARARPPQSQSQPAPADAQEKSVFQRQDEALRRSVDRYKRVDP